MENCPVRVALVETLPHSWLCGLGRVPDHLGLRLLLFKSRILSFRDLSSVSAQPGLWACITHTSLAEKHAVLGPPHPQTQTLHCNPTDTQVIQRHSHHLFCGCKKVW